MKAHENDRINCWIYSSSRQDQMYIYLKDEDDFDSLPEKLMQHFGSPSLVMELELHANRKLAKEDIYIVMDNLRERGYHLQMPPKVDAKLNNGE